MIPRLQAPTTARQGAQTVANRTSRPTAPALPASSSALFIAATGTLKHRVPA